MRCKIILALALIDYLITITTPIGYCKLYQDYYDSQLCSKRYNNDYETDTDMMKYTREEIKKGFYLKSVGDAL